ncbi:cytochrome P450 4C1-like isoform X1 [Adelges cooleyi]|uniref:cytochrome P450 4C1-like isoform X1 n=1 Tax=Adelges cooleyi TaxID=133065 RepID=UPI00217F71A7|nr:cytochrome P450 4C1-like isoform X1 [Adelges cooleyi]
MNFLFQQIFNMSYFQSIILTILLVISIIIIQRIKNQRQITLAAQIPGPKGHFIVGSLTIFTKGTEKLLENMKRLCKMYEHSLFKFWLFNKLIVCLSNADDIEVVMNSSNCFQKDFPYLLAEDVFSGTGVLTTNNVHDHKKNRKIISQWLKYSNLKSMITSFYDESKILAHILSEKCEGKPIELEIGRFFDLASMDSIGRTALGEEFDSKNKENHVFRNSYERLAKMFAYRLSNPWFLFSIFFSLSSKKHEQRNSQHLMHKFVNDLIQKKQVELNEKAKTTIIGSYDTDCVSQKPISLIEILLASEQQISPKEIRDELITIISAGHETTAKSNSLIIFMLAHHQDVQQNVYQEINSIFSAGDFNRSPTHEDLQKMEYLERVIKETMRLCSIAPLITRKVENEMMIGKYVIPTDANLLICIQCLHLNPKYYKDPEQFNPDNFLPDVCRRRHPFAYIPFSGGSRNCVGMKYAMLQMKTTISTLVRSYRFSPSEKCLTPKDLRLSFTLSVEFINGCNVKIEPRT